MPPPAPYSGRRPGSGGHEPQGRRADRPDDEPAGQALGQRRQQGEVQI